MKTRFLLKILIVSCLPFFANVSSAETVFVVGGGSCDVPHFHSVYQKGSGVYVTTGIERIYAICAAVVTEPRTIELNMDYPSIALKRVEAIFDSNLGNDEPVVLYRNGKILNSYDAELGTGWVDSEVLGLISIRKYPWVHHPELGWLFVQEGPIVGYQLSFWFYSPEQGWLWKLPSMEHYFHHDSGTFREVSSVVFLGSEFNLSFGEEKAVFNEDLKIRFSEVKEDSRCPIDVICGWEGRLVVTLEVNSQDLELSIGGQSTPSKVINGNMITLVEVVAPVPISRREPRDAHYVITLLVEKES